jgi:hypothetical protein
MPTYTDQLAALTAFTDGIINTNGVGAITGAVHNDNESAQNVSSFANLVAYDNYAYKVVRTYATDAENGQSLRDAYADAITQTPGGNPLSATNRFALLIPPGTYALGATGLDVNTEFVDLIGLGKPEETIITSVSNTATGLGTIIQTADDVRYKNIQIQNTAITYVVGDDSDDSGYAPQGTFANTVMEDVIFLNPEDSVTFVGAPFMRPLQSYAGTYVRCKGIDVNGVSVMFGGASGKFVDCETEWVSGFGVNLPASGTFINCSAVSGFGAGGDATGTFTRCRVSSGGFGSGALNVSGTFTDCISIGTGSFGYGSTATGKFYNCRSGAFSFGSSSSAAVYENCVAGLQSFSFVTGATLAGTYSNCFAGNQSFGGADGSVLSGTFNNCNAGSNSFGFTTVFEGSGVILSGTFNHCTAGVGSFGNGDLLQLSGTFNFCEAGDSSFGSIVPSAVVGVTSTGPAMSGTFNSCVAGVRSFGSSFDSRAIVDVTGKFYHCTAGERSFGYIATFAVGAEFHNCVCNGLNGWFGRGAAQSGLYVNCTSGGSSFQIETSANAKFVNCSAGTQSFGVAAVELAGTYINCNAGDSSFGWAPAGAGNLTLSGRFENCTAGNFSFGWYSGNAVTLTAPGTFINCRAGDESFVSKGLPSGGPTAFASGYFEGCSAGTGSFAGYSNQRKTGTFVRCYCFSTVADEGPITGPTGYMQDCTWITSDAGKAALRILNDDVKIYGGIYRNTGGTTDAIVTVLAAPYDAKIVGIKANGSINLSGGTNDATAGSLDTEGNFIYTDL